MRICMILEGCYPYVRGGVSTWMHEYICSLPQHQFVLWTIGAFEKDKGRFKYDLPRNVVEVHEVFLDAALRLRSRKNSRYRLSKDEKAAIGQLIQCRDPDWNTLFDLYNHKRKNPVSFFMSHQFLELLKEMCAQKYPFASFVDLFHTIRSMFLPLLYLLAQPVPDADVYHSAACGYGGILGALAAWNKKKPFVLTEHGIYTREREEEILRSKWIQPGFKDMWIEMFYMLSRCAYSRADAVTSLFDRAKLTQQALGCPAPKCRVIPNGIYFDNYIDLPLKELNGWIDIGAIVRFAPIKDIKTMIYAFASLKARVLNARLHILGDKDDEEYFEECMTLIQQLNVKDILIVGNTDVRKYMTKLDFTVLTSISEGQPLAVLESMAAARPVVSTDVGCCRELLEGVRDNFGAAGIVCPPMHHAEITRAMWKLCREERTRSEMGQAGRRRILEGFSHDRMMREYVEVYERVMRKWRA